jgi:hypothetical protein
MTNWGKRRQTASAKSGQNNDGLVYWKEALEILQKGWLVRTPVGQKIPAYVVLNPCGMAMCVKKPFAEKLFGYFVATK